MRSGTNVSKGSPMFSLFALATLAVDPSLARLQNEDARVAAMSWRLQTANADLCPKKSYLSGLSFHALSQYPATQRRMAAAQFGLGRHVAVAAVVPDSGAARAGVQTGDAIVEIVGTATPEVVADAGYAPVGKVEDMLDFALVRGAVELRIARNGKQQTVVVTGDTACSSRVQIVAGRSINAQADGRYVQLLAGMLDFVANDDELATIMAHEIAHNILRHIALKTKSKQSEYEADRLGVWLMARARYDVDAVVPFWTRFEKRTSAGIFADGTHPSPKKRIAAVAKAVAELKSQRAAGQPLLPSPLPIAQ
jgi:beta-barrel assembly-enhancing protease